jgi:hypothetical protein
LSVAPKLSLRAVRFHRSPVAPRHKDAAEMPKFRD